MNIIIFSYLAKINYTLYEKSMVNGLYLYDSSQEQFGVRYLAQGHLGKIEWGVGIDWGMQNGDTEIETSDLLVWWTTRSTFCATAINLIYHSLFWQFF